MTIQNIAPHDDLLALSRQRASSKVIQTVKKSLVESYIQDGWRVEKRNKVTTRVSKPKPQGEAFEDRVWTLLYRMGFSHMSGAGGALLVLNPKDDSSPRSQLDIVSIDDEVALVIECKSSASYAGRPQFQEELGKLNLVRQNFSQAISKEFPVRQKRQVALAMFLSQIRLSENDKKRAADAKVILFNDNELTYYEQLVAHLGSAARYQFLADLLPGKPIPGLNLRVPAIQTKMGSACAYTFSVSPAYLLKIAYVAHRAKGSPSDVDAYQRMIKRARLAKIREYIENDGVFPTNIVVSLEKKPRFDPIEQHGGQGTGRMGWLELRPSYKSAWIIDGQHRLFAYSGLSRAESATLSILAFEDLPRRQQAELFIDINAQQKSVSRALLLDLYGNLHVNSDDPAVRSSAILSKAIQSLAEDRDSPFYGRIKSSEEQRDPIKCITLTSLVGAMNRSELFAFTSRKGGSVEHGALWGGEDGISTMRRICSVLNFWFQKIATSNRDWWNLGANEGGGLAMNDGVAICIGVLRDTFEHLETKGNRLSRLADSQLLAKLEPYVEALGLYLESLDEDERKRFRELRGSQGVTTGRRRAEQAIHEQIPSFDPPGLADWLELEKRQTNDQATRAIKTIEELLQSNIIGELKSQFEGSDEFWWFQGVPPSVRKPAVLRADENENKRGSKENYLDLIDYREIIKHNWELLGATFGYEAAGAGKEKQTAWIVQVNEVRKVAFHASSGQVVLSDQLDMVLRYLNWLEAQTAQG